MYAETKATLVKPHARKGQAQSVRDAQVVGWERDGRDAPDLSIIVPLLDEEPTLRTLAERVGDACSSAGIDHEIVFVDDGSTDGGWTTLERLAEERADVRCIRLRRNFGKAAALSAGVKASRGSRIMTMDADLQDDPAEIARFVAKLDEGYDLVTGWKKDRRDPLGKTLPSKFFNAVTRKLSGLDLHDFNCGFKAADRRVYESISLYGELHRYVPVLAANLGFRVAEIPVKHHPRAAGRSKYGLERYARGFLDLLTVLTISRYRTRPGHLFGGVGIGIGILGAVILAYLFGVWLLTDDPIGNRPLLLFGIMLEILSANLISLGMMSELITFRTHEHTSEDIVLDAR